MKPPRPDKDRREGAEEIPGVAVDEAAPDGEGEDIAEPNEPA